MILMMMMMMMTMIFAFNLQAATITVFGGPFVRCHGDSKWRARMFTQVLVIVVEDLRLSRSGQKKRGRCGHVTTLLQLVVRDFSLSKISGGWLLM